MDFTQLKVAYDNANPYIDHGRINYNRKLFTYNSEDIKWFIKRYNYLKTWLETDPSSEDIEKFIAHASAIKKWILDVQLYIDQIKCCESPLDYEFNGFDDDTGLCALQATSLIFSDLRYYDASYVVIVKPIKDGSTNTCFITDSMPKYTIELNKAVRLLEENQPSNELLSGFISTLSNLITDAQETFPEEIKNQVGGLSSSLISNISELQNVQAELSNQVTALSEIQPKVLLSTTAELSEAAATIQVNLDQAVSKYSRTMNEALNALRDIVAVSGQTNQETVNNISLLYSDLTSVSRNAVELIQASNITVRDSITSMMDNQVRVNSSCDRIISDLSVIDANVDAILAEIRNFQIKEQSDFQNLSNLMTGFSNSVNIQFGSMNSLIISLADNISSLIRQGVSAVTNALDSSKDYLYVALSNKISSINPKINFFNFLRILLLCCGLILMVFGFNSLLRRL